MAERAVLTLLLLALHAVYAMYRLFRDMVLAFPLLMGRDDDNLILRRAASLKIPQHFAVVFLLPVHPPSSYGATWTLFYERKAQRKTADALHDTFRLAVWCALLDTFELSVYDPVGRLCTAFASFARFPDRLPDTVGNAPYGSCVGITVHVAGAQSTLPFSLYVPVADALLAEYRAKSKLERPHIRLNVLLSLTPAAFHDALLAQGVMTRDPDVVAVSGGTSQPLELHGFPCWAVRLADLRTLPYHAWLGRWTVPQFLDTLKYYARSEQRFGA
ncbi:hypothetical protein MBRA1_000208 [Malassezia brasiliensis]|uniref:ditrans,polycis-polyprenyl diphosphate synthase [(2E,6E)-farnesyldiphosphate specific] n=1 Tax=Malassezia brasiliensis TaxID=1821822 RepID=A0AAF0IM53_9BASI|nr:hypothetical protein MBRA1_000208 [Malassezia brasiliensis]